MCAALLPQEVTRGHRSVNCHSSTAGVVRATEDISIIYVYGYC